MAAFFRNAATAARMLVSKEITGCMGICDKNLFQPGNRKGRTMRKKRWIFLLVALILAGCVSTPTTPDQRAANEQRRAADRAANEYRHAVDERRHAEEGLRHKFARYSSAELKLMDTRYKELEQSSGRDVNITMNSPLARQIWGDSDKNNIERVLEIERELLRRWKAGDTEAYLPEFEPITPAVTK